MPPVAADRSGLRGGNGARIDPLWPRRRGLTECTPIPARQASVRLDTTCRGKASAGLVAAGAQCARRRGGGSVGGGSTARRPIDRSPDCAESQWRDRPRPQEVCAWPADSTRFGVAVSLAAVVLSLSAAAALAGEITGNGKTLEPLRANSICAYSGLNDDPTGIDPENGPPGRVQSWGQIPKEGKEFLTSIGFNPGNACRGGSL